jgi:hypothetical protein
MSRLSLAFFGAAVLYAIAGMGLGMFMGASGDHSLMPVHAHTNLAGWATLAIMGGFYQLAGDRASQRLGWANFAISNLGNLTMLSLLTLLLRGDKRIEPFMPIGDTLVAFGMLLFGLSVLAVAGRSKAA